jgi:uncharacterized lipoprotein YajG
MICMKHIVLLLAIILMASCSSSSEKSAGVEPEKKESAVKSAVSSDNVFICTGSSSKRYHCERDCKGLSRCSGEIEELSEEEAEDMGRTPCKICY